MLYWILGGALFVLIVVGGMWWYAKHAPVREDSDE